MGFVVGLLIVINLCFAVAAINLRIDLTREQKWSAHLSDTSQTWMERGDAKNSENAELRKKLLQSQRDYNECAVALTQAKSDNDRLAEDLDTEKRVNADHQEQIVARDSELVRYRTFAKDVTKALRTAYGAKA